MEEVLREKGQNVVTGSVCVCVCSRCDGEGISQDSDLVIWVDGDNIKSKS